MTRQKLTLLLTLLFALPAARALEIPLERAPGKTTLRRGAVIGFVDMDRVYKEFPETRRAKQDYQKEADRLRQSLSDKELELSDLREQLAVLKDALAADAAVAVSSPSVAVSTVAAESAPAYAPSSADMSIRESTLAAQESALLQAKKDAAAELTAFERRRAAQIFGKLYQALVQLADERGVDLVLDKSALLYGQVALDLTETLSRRVRGLPDTDEDAQ
jgi:Skp family chaperone for outer membrane proteins